MGKQPYSKDQRENRTSNTLRTEIREQSLGTTDGNIRILKSLKTCYLKDHMKLLDEHIAKLNLEETLSHLRGLKAVLQMLQGQLPMKMEKIPSKVLWILMKHLRFSFPILKIHHHLIWDKGIREKDSRNYCVIRSMACAFM